MLVRYSKIWYLYIDSKADLAQVQKLPRIDRTNLISRTTSKKVTRKEKEKNILQYTNETECYRMVTVGDGRLNLWIWYTRLSLYVAGFGVTPTSILANSRCFFLVGFSVLYVSIYIYGKHIYIYILIYSYFIMNFCLYVNINRTNVLHRYNISISIT
jgi:hypothetical protein